MAWRLCKIKAFVHRIIIRGLLKIRELISILIKTEFERVNCFNERLL
jgi:hypothetical protein